MLLVYRICIAVFFKCLRFASLFNADVKKWVDGRKNQHTLLNNISGNYIWVHCASLGEFEQGRSIIEHIKRNTPNQKICLSFFSPSGYEIRKSYPHADLICYFPSDTYFEISQFINKINPTYCIFVRYEFWFNTLSILKEKAIPYYFISVSFYKLPWFFSNFTKSLEHLFSSAAQIFVQDQNTLQLLQQRQYTNVTLAGDTRLDAILQSLEEHKRFPIIESFIDNYNTIILGSIYAEDFDIIDHTIAYCTQHHWICIIAPHKPEPKFIHTLLQRFPNTITLSDLEQTNQIEKQILIIDRIGILKHIYRLSNIAYIGGGFNKSIHNVLEPLCSKIPVCFGPRYHKFPEAHAIEQLQLGGKVDNGNQFIEKIIYFQNSNHRNTLQQKIKTFISENRGASEKIIRAIDN